MSKYLGHLNDTKISIPLKLYHKINSLGGCRWPTYAHPCPRMGQKKMFYRPIWSRFDKKISPNLCKSTYTKEILIFCILAWCFGSVLTLSNLLGLFCKSLGPKNAYFWPFLAVFSIFLAIPPPLLGLKFWRVYSHHNWLSIILNRKDILPGGRHSLYK